ncbi:prephenate dehydrogenase [Pseudoruegeria sp. HB172150]|uniref:prephenate dehydrogenase n=1 Tax=Pseudoruegeria sp. HB172150 TaxID=2721164 RepID=UPI0015557FEA|nr:prephenate dehydrogenase [Pseudoruegeria sp. HB172150]
MRNGTEPTKNTVGIVGFGAFGQLMARELRRYVPLCAYDPDPGLAAVADRLGVELTDLAQVARCHMVVLAVPVAKLAETVAAIAPHFRPGALVLDVGSVKVKPAEIMRRGLPDHVDIVATHPLFGPQSAANGVAGLKIALCPVRGRRHLRLAAFLRRALGLRVIITTPEAHDREAATVQGLTHLIAKVLVRMEPLPGEMTTLSYDRLIEAVDMVRHDAPGVFEAIERDNPFADDVRRQFFGLLAELDAEMSARAMACAAE